MIMLNHKTGTSLHTDKHPHCFDETCPCNNIFPSDPADREFMDVLMQVEGDDEFTDAMQEGYMAWYDQRTRHDLPVLSGRGLYEFMTTQHHEYSPKWNAGFVAGMLMAIGESRPDFKWESAAPPVESAKPSLSAK